MEFIYSTRNPTVPTAYSRLDAMHTQCEILLPFLPEDEARALVDFLQLCETFRKATSGYFDVTAGSRVADRNVVLDASAHTVRFSRPGMRLDLGGFAKGFVLEQAVRMVSERAGSALLSFGGSSVAAVGKHPLGAPWPVAVAHSYYADRTAHTFQLEGEALSVSGKDPHGRGHIIDPATGNTLEKGGLVAVTGPSAMVTEVLSTALWVARSGALPTGRP